MQAFRVKRGADFAFNGQTLDSPSFGGDQVMCAAFVAPIEPSNAVISVFEHGGPSGWRRAWIATEQNGQPIPGCTMMGAPGAENGVVAGNTVTLRISTKGWTAPPGMPPKMVLAAGLSPILLQPGQLYWLHVRNEAVRFGPDMKPDYSAPGFIGTCGYHAMVTSG